MQDVGIRQGQPMFLQSAFASCQFIVVIAFGVVRQYDGDVFSSGLDQIFHSFFCCSIVVGTDGIGFFHKSCLSDKDERYVTAF